MVVYDVFINGKRISTIALHHSGIESARLYAIDSLGYSDKILLKETKKKRQFSTVPCKYGAPMGRSEYGKPSLTVRLFRVKLAQGYDDGGAYWGADSYGNGNLLYCAIGNEYRDFVRASSREDASVKLGITQYLSKKAYKKYISEDGHASSIN